MEKDGKSMCQVKGQWKIGMVKDEYRCCVSLRIIFAYGEKLGCTCSEIKDEVKRKEEEVSSPSSITIALFILFHAPLVDIF